MIQTVEVSRKIPLQVRPKPVSLGDSTFFVVTADNWDKFIEKYKKENGDPWVFYAMSVRSYESLSLNVADVARYLEQQKQMIIYYETAISSDSKEVAPTKENEEK